MKYFWRVENQMYLSSIPQGFHDQCKINMQRDESTSCVMGLIHTCFRRMTIDDCWYILESGGYSNPLLCIGDPLLYPCHYDDIFQRRHSPLLRLQVMVGVSCVLLQAWNSPSQPYCFFSSSKISLFPS